MPALVALLCVTVGLLVFLAVRPAITRDVAGRIIAFVAIFLLPVVGVSMGFTVHMERAKKKEFCASCHVMDPYHKSLLVDDEEFLPARHYQNNWVPREKACYTCHTSYAMFGDVQSKLRGLRHLATQYLGTIPDTLKLYEPYNNRECLHCHDGARTFVAVEAHAETDTTMASMLANRMSCMTQGCHDVVHNVDELSEAQFWKER